MNNSNFDDFIRKEAQNELNVPEGLDWEQMHIPIPLKKDKRRGLFYLRFFVGSLLTAFLSIVLYCVIYSPIKIDDNHNSEVIAQELSHKGENHSSLESIEENKKKESFKKSMIIEKSRNQHSISESIYGKEKKRLVSEPIYFEEQKKLALNIQDYNSPYLKETNQETNQEANQEANLKFSDNENHDSHTATSINDDNIAIYGKSNDQDRQAEKFETLPPLEKLDFAAQFIYESEPSDRLFIRKAEETRSKHSFYLAIGLNIAQNKYSQGLQAQALEEAENVDLGNCIQTGIKIPILRNLFLLTGLHYQKLNYNFKYTENLGTEYSLSTAQKTTRLKHINHRNSIKTIGIELGIEKLFSLGPNWGSNLSCSLIPSYRLRSNGKSLRDDYSVFDIESIAQDPQFLLNAQIGAGIYYHLNRSTFFSGVSYQDSFSKNHLFQNSEMILRSRSLIVRLGVEQKF